ncbi:asr2978 [Nostoc sp. PCC 7120 = FACHB-418]|nr:asr2978 [Nostoc sp. PCC 7120 = FACHB-418]
MRNLVIGNWTITHYPLPITKAAGRLSFTSHKGMEFPTAFINIFYSFKPYVNINP